MIKRVYQLGFLVYATLLIFSILFYKERTAFVDIAYHTFMILKDGDFTIQNYRFAAMATQLFPLIGSKLSLPLDAIAKMYSAGFILFYLTCYIICGVVLKNYRMALVLLLFNILFVSDTFYWAQSELPQGAAFMIMTLAYISDRNIKDMRLWGIGMAILGIVTFAFAHPLLLFPFTYAMAFFFTRSETPPSRKQLITSFCIYLCCIVSKSIFFKTPYDTQAAGHAGNFIKLFPHYFDIHSNKQFIYECFHNYYWIPICSAAIAILYASKREWLELVLFTGSFVAYLLLINISYPGPEVLQFYIENLYLPLGIMIAIPLVYDLLPVLDKRSTAMVVFACLLLSGVIRIYRSHELYTNRLHWLRKDISQNMDKKVMIDQSMLPPGTPYLMTWGTPYEFWLLSTIENGQSASILYSEQISGVEWAAPERKSMVTTWGAFEYKTLPAQYFIFKDTTQAYTVLKP